MPLLEVKALTVDYGAVRAVRGIDLTVEKGEVVCLLGANGAGKTTTLSAIVGLVRASGGEVLFAGQNCRGLPPDEIVRRGLTLTPEGRKVFAGLTVEENLNLGGATKPKPQRRILKDRMFGLFPLLAERRGQLAGTLSGGEQQQLAIARSLMSEPQCLLLDEPSLGLAPKVVEGIFALIRTLRTEGVTMLLVEQNVVQALEVADRGYVLATGAVVTEGPAAQLRDEGDLVGVYLGAA